MPPKTKLSDLTFNLKQPPIKLVAMLIFFLGLLGGQNSVFGQNNTFAYPSNIPHNIPNDTNGIFLTRADMLAGKLTSAYLKSSHDGKKIKNVIGRGLKVTNSDSTYFITAGQVYGFVKNGSMYIYDDDLKKFSVGRKPYYHKALHISANLLIIEKYTENSLLPTFVLGTGLIGSVLGSSASTNFSATLIGAGGGIVGGLGLYFLLSAIDPNSVRSQEVYYRRDDQTLFQELSIEDVLKDFEGKPSSLQLLKDVRRDAIEYPDKDGYWLLQKVTDAR